MTPDSLSKDYLTTGRTPGRPAEAAHRPLRLRGSDMDATSTALERDERGIHTYKQRDGRLRSCLTTLPMITNYGRRIRQQQRPGKARRPDIVTIPQIWRSTG